MESFWRTETGSLDRHRTTPELPEAADLVVIGGGYSAAAFVEHLLDDWDQASLSILILEARQLCSGATGRNGEFWIVLLVLVMSAILQFLTRR
jgi:hypothetical protein